MKGMFNRIVKVALIVVAAATVFVACKEKGLDTPKPIDYGSVVIDGVTKKVAYSEFVYYHQDLDCTLQIFLSDDNSELLMINIEPEYFDGKEIDLTKKYMEGPCWDFLYLVNMENVFCSSGNANSTGLPVFNKGTLYTKLSENHDTYEIRLKDGEIVDKADNTKTHTISIEGLFVPRLYRNFISQDDLFPLTVVRAEVEEDANYYHLFFSDIAEGDSQDEITISIPKKSEGKWIDLTKKEAKNSSGNYWSIKNPEFSSDGNPESRAIVFDTGSLYVKRLDKSGNFVVLLWNGQVKVDEAGNTRAVVVEFKGRPSTPGATIPGNITINGEKKAIKYVSAWYSSYSNEFSGTFYLSDFTQISFLIWGCDQGKTIDLTKKQEDLGTMPQYWEIRGVYYNPSASSGKRLWEACGSNASGHQNHVVFESGTLQYNFSKDGHHLKFKLDNGKITDSVGGDGETYAVSIDFDADIFAVEVDY